MTDINRLKVLAESLVIRAGSAGPDISADFLRLITELEQCASALPGTYYMDPPDGGNVSIPEQIRRMAKDAARYRALRDEGYLHNWASLHVCDEHLRAQRTDEAIDSVLNIGAKQ
ncbi:TPA: hypothetical protein ACQGPQ_001090 [Pseudomonas aeruginosa]